MQGCFKIPKYIFHRLQNEQQSKIFLWLKVVLHFPTHSTPTKKKKKKKMNDTHLHFLRKCPSELNFPTQISVQFLAYLPISGEFLPEFLSFYQFPKTQSAIFKNPQEIPNGQLS